MNIIRAVSLLVKVKRKMATMDLWHTDNQEIQMTKECLRKIRRSVKRRARSIKKIKNQKG